MESTAQFPNAGTLLQYMEENGLQISAPIEIDKIARHLGIVVEDDITLESRDVIGEISFSGETPIVKINPVQNTYDSRRRFTLAHEIGHYCLHSASNKRTFTDSRKTMSRSESYWDSYESEANAFAAQLLMPKHLVIEEGNKVIVQYKDENNAPNGMPVSNFVDSMASIFRVSRKAMEYRLKNLRIIT